MEKKIITPKWLTFAKTCLQAKMNERRKTHVVLFIIQRHLGEHVAGFGVNSEGNIIRNKVGNLRINTFIGVLCMHVTY